MRKYFKIFTCGVQDASAYRGNLIVGVLSNFIITAVMFYIWKVIYETNVIIDNYNWEDMKIYLFISFICNSTLSWSAETKISKKIITGELTSDLIKPMGFMSMTFFETAGAGVPVSMISILRERFKFCVNRKTDIRYVISYRGQNLFFRVLSLFVL